MTDTSTAAGTSRTGITRPVLLAGIVLGTCLTILTMWNGVRLRVPDLPPVIGAALGAVIVWALFMAVAAVLSELTVRHHRAALGHGWRCGKRGSRAAAGWSRRAAQGAAVRSRPWRTRIVTAMRTRWTARTAEPLLFRRKASQDDPGAGEEPGNSQGGREQGPTYSWGPADSPSGWSADGPQTAHRWAQHMSTGGGKPQVVTGYPPGGGPGKTVTTYVNGEPAAADCDLCGTPLPPGYAGIAHPDCIDAREPVAVPASRSDGRSLNWALRHSPKLNSDGALDADAPSPPSPAEGSTSMTVSKIAPDRRARRAAARSGGPVPSDWGPVIAQTADFEPEDDGQLLEWMGRQVTGLSAWAEALVDFYDHATNTIGIDPTASAMLHDVADAAAQAAETMGAAKATFTEHYELPREFAGNGGLMTHDGRWITGEGA